MVVQVLESTVAAILVLITIVYLFTPIDISTNFSEMGYNCLKDLDNKGLLSHYASNDMEQDLKNDLEICLPLDLTVRICRTTDCMTDLPEKEIYTSSYLLSEDVPILINLWMWIK